MTDSTEKKKRLPLWRRIAIWVILIVIVLMCAAMLADFLVGKQMAAEIGRIRDKGQPVCFSDLKGDIDETGTKEDAAIHYFEAIMPISSQNLEALKKVNSYYRQALLTFGTDKFPAELRQKVSQSLEPFGPFLRKLDTASLMPLSYFDFGIAQGVQVCKKYLAPVRVAGYLLSLRTLDFILNNKGDAAANSAVTMLKMTRVFDSQPTMMLHLAKMVIVVVACEDIAILLQRGNLSDSSMSRLQDALREVVGDDSVKRMLLAEMVRQIDIARNLISKKTVDELLTDPPADLPERLKMPASRWARFRIRQNSVTYFRKMIDLISAAEKPWPHPLNEIYGQGDQPPKELSPIESSTAMLTKITAETMALTRSLALAAAIQRYRLNNNSLPDSLDMLVPDYIDSVPADPFTNNRMLYKKDSRNYLVYSAGINRIDDGGAVISLTGEKTTKDTGVKIKFAEPGD